MGLERAIHERWATDYLLCALLPVAQLTTGTARGETNLPYVVLTRAEDRVLVRTSSGTSIDRVVLRFTVWAASLDQAQEIAQAVARRSDRADFALPDDGVLNMQRAAATQSQADDGSWRLEVDYAVIHRRQAVSTLG